MTYHLIHFFFQSMSNFCMISTIFHLLFLSTILQSLFFQSGLQNINFSIFTIFFSDSLRHFSPLFLPEIINFQFGTQKKHTNCQNKLYSQSQTNTLPKNHMGSIKQSRETAKKAVAVRPKRKWSLSQIFT
jgi:hypothetical protein